MRTVDSFGVAKFGDRGEPIRGRLIQIDETEFGFFPESDERKPRLLRFSEPPRVRGRVLSGDLHAEDPAMTEFSFARASCGCQTPAHLRGAARRFTAQLTPEGADA